MKKVVENRRLGDVVEIVMGQAPPSKTCNFDHRGTPFVKVGEFGDLRPQIREWTTNPLRMACRSDVLLCVVGATCGKINLGEECAIGRSVAAIRPDPKALDQMYLYYFMMTLIEKLRSDSVGAAQTVISKEMVTGLSVPLPPLPEQQRIVQILDEAFAAIAKAQANVERNIENARALFESYLNEVFTRRGEGWVEKTIDELCELEYGYTEKARVAGDLRYIRITDTDELGLLRADGKMYVDSFEGADSYLLAKGDLLMARTGASAGNVLLYEGDENAVFASYLIRIKFKQAISNELYWLFTKSQLYWNQVSRLSAGSAQPQFNGGALRQVVFPFPASIDAQRHVTRKLSALLSESRRSSKVYKQKRAVLEVLKTSLLHEAFMGEL